MVKLVLTIAEGVAIFSYLVFVKFPLYMAGYKWCCICSEKISPKAEMTTKVFVHFGGEQIDHYCKTCNEALGRTG